MNLRKLLVWTGILGGLAAFFFYVFQSTLWQGVGIGDPVEDLGLTTLEGEPFDLNEWRGKGVVLRLSSSTCSTCPHDYGLLAQWQAEFGDRVQVVAVQVGDTAATLRASLMGEHVEVPILLDTNAAAAEKLGLKLVPAVFFLTPRGTLSSVSNVEVARTDMRAHVRLLLAGGPNMEREFRHVTETLQCPECDGRSAWESDSASSIAMREHVRTRLLAGERADEIIAAYAGEYGEWILLAPPTSGLAALAWVLPIAVGFFGAGAWWVVLYRARKKRRTTPDEVDQAAVEEAKKRLSRRIDDYM